ncbi:MAG: PAS domain-containing protein, partial [Rhizobacter sp.]
SIPAHRRPRLHLAVGLRLLSASTAPPRTDAVFAVVHQLNLGRGVLRRPSHRDALAALNLQAARAARDQTAYTSALGFAETGLALLEPSAAVAFELQLLCADCDVLLREDTRAAARLAALLPTAPGRLDRARVNRLQVVLHVVRSEYALAVAVAIRGLEDFGVALSPHPPRAEVRAHCERVLARLDALPMAALLDASHALEPGAEAAMALLAEMFAPACFTDESLAILHLCHMVELTLDHGLTAGSPHGLAWFGIMVGHHFGRHRDAGRLAGLARDLVVRRGFAAYEAKSLFALEITEVWVRPLEHAIATSRAAYRVAVERGDLAVACFACNHTVNDLLVRGEPLEMVADEIERSLAIVRRAGYKDVVDELVTQQRFVMALRGRTDAAASFDGPGFSSAAFEREWTTERMPTMVFWYWVLRAQLSYIAGDAAHARAHLDTASQWLWSSPVHVQYANYHLFSALALAADGDGPPPVDRIEAHLAQLRVWARVNPATFADKVALVTAEVARVRGDAVAAAAGYERAAQLASGTGARHVEAMASECAARFHAGLGLDTSANAWWMRARQAYAAWGAHAKLRALDALVSADDATVATKETRTGSELLELAVVRRVSEAIAGEVDIDALVRTLMVTAIEHAGAQRALLLLPHDGGMRTRASAVTGRDGIAVSAHREAPSAEDLPLGLLDEVCRRHRQVLLDDAARSPQHAGDPYMAQARPRSVLCIPLLKQGRLVAVLYLENRLTPHVFSPDRVAMLGLIATQSAIALENAALYSDLVRENQDRQRAEAEVRRARDALEESESRFRQMAEATPDVIWITDVHPERVLYANPGFERIWGRTVASLYEDPRVWVEGIHPDDRAAVGDQFATWIAAAEGPWHAQFRVLRPDGSIRHVLDRGFATKDASGHVTRVSGVATDITERHAVEVALKESEQRFALAVAGANDGIWDWDLTTQRVFMSDRAQRIY